MAKHPRLVEFENQVEKKFNLYKSLFLSLPFHGISDIGHTVPILTKITEQGLNAGKEPLEILDKYFENQTEFETTEEKIDYMFRVIQYVERIIVLYDSIEDAAFVRLNKYSSSQKLKDLIRQSKDQQKKAELIKNLNNFKVRLVLTAHPTQFYPASVLDIISKLRELVISNDIEGIDLTLRQLGITSLMNSEKPTPFDEARNIIYFLRNVHYEAISQLMTDIHNNLPEFNNYELISLGFWPGGDRDGNPYVDYKTTKKVADELRISLMKCYYNDTKKLEKLLTFRGVLDKITPLKEKLYSSIFPDKYLRLEEIINPLEEIKEKVKNDYDSLYLDEIDNLIIKAKIFKTHFATLDIRQHHKYHKQIIEKALIKQEIIKDNIDELNETQLIDILLNQDISIATAYYTDPIEIDTILNIKSIIDIQKNNGEKAVNRYIISNSEDIFSVLFVFAIIKNIYKNIENIPFDIIPLFESMEAMQNAETIMDKLLSIPDYKKHLEFRGNFQTIMLGFSDGTKDGGYIKANWSIFRAKEILSAVCKKHQIEPIFFDGRGGPPARGGGKSYRFYASQSDRIANNEIQTTIQGQTITSKYGVKDQFIHNGQQLINAGIMNKTSGNAVQISEEERSLFDKLSEDSFKKYIELKNHPKFIDYLENKSTLKYFSRAKIASRPAKRGADKKLTLNDLRAISYVSSWSQLKQNVPGYFGIGTAIKLQKDAGNIDAVKSLFSNIQFFKSLILNSMMVLSKTNFAFTEYLGRDPEYGEFWQIIKDEYDLTKEMMLEISGYSELMEEEIVSQHSIKIREQIVLPLLLIQQYALQKIEKNDENKIAYEKIVERSLYGNINASRNSV